MKPQFKFTVQTVIDDGRVSREEIEEIRTWLKTAEEQIPELCDEQIALFLMSCDREKELTKNTIRVYYKVKKNAPELFDRRDLERSDLLHQLQVLDFVVIPKRTPDGCVILHHKLRDTNYHQYNMEQAMNVFFMVSEGAINTDPPPTGLIVLFDMKGVGLMHLTRIRMGNLKSFLQFVQEAIPIKLKAIHVLNSVYFVDKILAILKPFMKMELLKMIHFYPPTMDMEVFYKKIPRDCLPADYGGLLGSARELHNETIDKTREMKDHFDAEEAQRKSV